MALRLPSMPAVVGPPWGGSGHKKGGLGPVHGSENDMPSKECDTLVVGAGGGGYPAAFRLAAQGRQVVMVDPRGNLGGHCLYEGCIPSKTVREASRLMESAIQGGRAGVPLALAGTVSELWPRVRQFKDSVQTRRYAQHTEELNSITGLTFFTGTAALLDSHTARITTAEEDWCVHFRFAILATGSSAHTLETVSDAWTSHDLFAWNAAVNKLPARLVIIGGGYIGVELAMMLKPFGVQLTVLEMAPEILPQMDEEIQQEIGKALREVADVVVNARVVKVTNTPEHRLVQFQTPAGLRQQITDQVLVATGRVPNIENLGLDAAGIHYSQHGIGVDAALRTNQPHIFACGDVTGLSMLFHAAVRMSQVAAANILSHPEPVDTFSAQEMPATVFSTPEAHTVGLTLKAAQTEGIRAVEIRRPMGVEARAQIAEEQRGFLKMVVDQDRRTVLGIHAVGVDAADLAAVSHIIVRERMTVDQVAHMTFPHPTQFEMFDRLTREAML